MYYRASLASAAFLLLAAIALIVPETFGSHVSASRPGGSRNSEAKTVTVVIRGFKFDPATVTVNEGDTVEWENNDIVPHTATEDVSKPAFDSGTISTGAAWRYVARHKGTYNYICSLHPNMEGKLIVQ